MSTTATIEAKVIAAAAGSGLGAAVGTFLLWALGATVWGAPADAGHAATAAAAVPEPVGALLVIVVGILGAAVAGYAAPHTPRPDLSQQPVAVPAEPAASPPAPTGATAAPADPTPAPEGGGV